MSTMVMSRLHAGTLRAELSRRATVDRLSRAGFELDIAAAPELIDFSNARVADELQHCRDDRKEIDDPAVGQIAREQFRAVAAVIPVSQSLIQRPNGDWVLASPTMGDYFDVAPTERFLDQPVAAIGAASLISPRVVVTAAHIAPNSMILRKLRFVFGYTMNGTRPITVFPARDVYEASLLFIDQPRDIATLQLDRPAPVQRKPLKRRIGSAVDDDEPLYVMGFPIGLPAKFAENGRVINNRSRRFFTTDLDVMDANSGSPVFSALHNDLVGVVSTAPVGFTTVNGRLVSDFCHDPNDVPIGISRISNLPR